MRVFGRHGREAVTLVEILVAIGILTVSLFGILEMFLWSRQVSSDAELRSKGSASARSALETFRAAGPAALGAAFTDRAEGAADMVTWPPSPVVTANGDVQWQARLSRVAGRPGILQAEVRARWGRDAADPLGGGPGDSVRIVEWLPAEIE